MAPGKLVFTTGPVGTPTFLRNTRKRKSTVVSSTPPQSAEPILEDRDPSPLFEPEGPRPHPETLRTIEKPTEASDEASVAHTNDDVAEKYNLPTQPATDESVTYVDINERQYYRDHKNVKREIWRPGDGDGNYIIEYAGGPVTGRYRFYQSSFGPIKIGENEPPKYVILDDQAAHEILVSKLYNKSKLGKFWSHDFSQANGTMRSGRPNRGRAAAPMTVSHGDDEMQGDDQKAWALVGVAKNNTKYFFTGERSGYKNIEYYAPARPTEEAHVDHTANVTPTVKPSVEPSHPFGILHLSQRAPPPEPGPLSDQYGHARRHVVEHVPQPDRLARTDTAPRHKRPRLNVYLYRTPSPVLHWPKEKAKPEGRAGGGDDAVQSHEEAGGCDNLALSADNTMETAAINGEDAKHGETTFDETAAGCLVEQTVSKSIERSWAFDESP